MEPLEWIDTALFTHVFLLNILEIRVLHSLKNECQYKIKDNFFTLGHQCIHKQLIKIPENQITTLLHHRLICALRIKQVKL